MITHQTTGGEKSLIKNPTPTIKPERISVEKTLNSADRVALMSGVLTVDILIVLWTLSKLGLKRWHEALL